MSEQNTRVVDWQLDENNREANFKSEKNEIFVRGFNASGSDFAVLVLADGFFNFGLGEGETDTGDLPREVTTVTVKALGTIKPGQRAAGDLEFFRVGKDRRAPSS